MIFHHVTLGQRVLFGSGKAAENIAQELDRLDARRVMVISSARDAQTSERLVPDNRVSVRWTDVAQHVPADLAERARGRAREGQADLLVAIGGGSAIGLGKAVALTSRLPLIAVPTTYAGSEATDMWGITEDRTKTTGNAPQVLPVSVVYDADLSMTLPVDLAISSGLNALAHCVDSLWAPRADPINQALALEGARALARALPGITADAGARQPREQALYGCYLAAVAFASAGSGLHHKICHTLGGTFGLPHAQTHAVVLPYVLALNGPGTPEVMGRLATALGATDDKDSRTGGGTGDRNDDAGPATALTRLLDLRAAVHAPDALEPLGLVATEVSEAVCRVAAVVPPSNPVTVGESDLERLLTDAQRGDLPRSPYRLDG